MSRGRKGGSGGVDPKVLEEEQRKAEEIRRRVREEREQREMGNQ